MSRKCGERHREQMCHVLSSQENSVSASFVELNLLFLAALGRHCCTWAFSSGGVRASSCGGFSCCGAQALGHRGFSVVEQGSVVAAPGL